jgi:hypothetical protein
MLHQYLKKMFEYLEFIIFTPDFLFRRFNWVRIYFDFQIAQRDKEIVIKSFNTINKSNLPTFFYFLGMTLNLFEKKLQKKTNTIAIINDIDKVKTFLEALKSKMLSLFFGLKRFC